MNRGNSLQRKRQPPEFPVGRSECDGVTEIQGGYPDIDIKRLVFNANTIFNPLHQESLFDCQAVAVHDGRVLLNIALPCEMSRFFVALLESMIGFFRVMDRKSQVASSNSRWIDPKAVEAREKVRKDFINTACSLFDGFVAEGLSMNDAVKRTNSALKAQKHPWATSYGVVSSTLRAEGKLRKTKRVKPGKENRG